MLAAVIACALTLETRVTLVPETYRIVPGLSQATYSVDEVFLEENNRFFTAVGTTAVVSGDVIVDRARPSDSRISEIVIGVRELTSDSDRRDRALRGRPFRNTVVGNLTAHGQTRETTWRGEATIAGDTLRGVARTQVKMTAFGIEVPRFLWLRVAEDIRLELRFVAVAIPRPS
jgi:polyisoprenoid-binding protein YceI